MPRTDSGTNSRPSLREKDPILGIVNLTLKDLFNESSEVTRLFAIQEGIGFGYVRHCTGDYFAPYIPVSDASMSRFVSRRWTASCRET